MNEIKSGTYMKTYNTGYIREYIYIKNSIALLVSKYFNKDKQVVEANINIIKEPAELDYIKNSLNETMSISYNTFIEQYKSVLGYADDIIGTRGQLIKPSELNERLYTDESGIIKQLF